MDKELFALVAEGDDHAFRQVFDKYWPQVYGSSLRLCKSPELAKDLSQDIFVRLWESRARLKELNKPESYLYILSRNLVLDHLRKKVFDTTHIDYLVEYFQDASINPQEKTEFRELELTLQQAVDTLPEKQKQVYQLSRLQGLTHEQIAAQLGISEVSSKTYIVRALQHIRQYMIDHSDEGMVEMALAILLLS